MDRWFGCVDSGLPRLRGLDDPPTRGVTAALESVRATRAKISIRDWPDDPAAASHRVQGQWVRMTEAVAMLRSQLESLAGRTIRTVTPGDGNEDFPGAVEVVVDATGAALAPPVAAETLSALLLRLQTDYDEELTKTINELLGSTFIEHLRDRLAEAERTAIGHQRQARAEPHVGLRPDPAAHPGAGFGGTDGQRRARRAGTRFHPAARIDAGAAARFPGRPGQRRAGERAGRGRSDWRSRLAEMLDYRRWFELRTGVPHAAFGPGRRAAGGAHSTAETTACCPAVPRSSP